MQLMSFGGDMCCLSNWQQREAACQRDQLLHGRAHLHDTPGYVCPSRSPAELHIISQQSSAELLSWQ